MIRLLEHGWLIDKRVVTVDGRTGRIRMLTEDYKQAHVEFKDGRLVYFITDLKILG